jgi:hypothetical protein
LFFAYFQRFPLIFIKDRSSLALTPIQNCCAPVVLNRLFYMSHAPISMHSWTKLNTSAAGLSVGGLETDADLGKWMIADEYRLKKKTRPCTMYKFYRGESLSRSPAVTICSRLTRANVNSRDPAMHADP